MELFELILILLACVMASSVIDQFIPHFSLPLLQIGVGLIIALILPSLAQVHIDAELFLMLFIAPLLYRDSREVSRTTLWANRWSVLSMAIALVIVSVLTAGFVLHQITEVRINLCFRYGIERCCRFIKDYDGCIFI